MKTAHDLITAIGCLLFWACGLVALIAVVFGQAEKPIEVFALGVLLMFSSLIFLLFHFMSWEGRR